MAWGMDNEPVIQHTCRGRIPMMRFFELSKPANSIPTRQSSYVSPPDMNIKDYKRSMMAICTESHLYSKTLLCYSISPLCITPQRTKSTLPFISICLSKTIFRNKVTMITLSDMNARHHNSANNH